MPKAAEEILKEARKSAVTQATFQEQTQLPEDPQAAVKAAEGQKEIVEERVSSAPYKKAMKDLEELEFMAEYVRRQKEALASIDFLTDPRNPTDLNLAIGSDTKEVFKDAAKKLAGTAPIPPNLQNADPNKNQAFITAALASMTAAIGTLRTGDPLSGATGALKVQAAGLEGQAELAKQKSALNAILQKEYTKNVSNYRGTVEKVHQEFMKQTGANERKQLETAAKHWNDKMKNQAAQRITDLNEKKAKLKQMTTIQGIDQSAIENQTKIIDKRIENLNAMKQIQTQNADRNLKAQIATNAAVFRASKLQLDVLNAKHNKLLFSKTEKAARYTPAPLFAADQLIKSDIIDVQFASSNLFKHYERRKDILDRFSPEKIIGNDVAIGQLDKMIENSLNWGMWSLNNKDSVIYDYSPEFLLNSVVTKTGANEYKAAWPEEFDPVIAGIPYRRNKKINEAKSVAAQNFFELANALIGIKEQVAKVDYDEQLRDKKIKEKTISKILSPLGKSPDDLINILEDTAGMTEEEAKVELKKRGINPE